MPEEKGSQARAKKRLRIAEYLGLGVLALVVVGGLGTWLLRSFSAAGMPSEVQVLAPTAGPGQLLDIPPGCEPGRLVGGQYYENCPLTRDVQVYQRQADDLALFVDTTGGVPVGNPSYAELGCAERTRYTGDSWIGGGRDALFVEYGSYLAKLLTREAGQNTWRWVATYPNINEARAAYCGAP